MSHWIDRLQKHPVHQALIEVRKLLPTVERKSAQESEHIEATQRLLHVMNFAKQTLKNLDPHLAAVGPLDQVAKSLQGMATYLSSYVGDGAIVHLTNANGVADQMLTQLCTLTRLDTAQDIQGIQDTAVSFRRSVGQHNRIVKSDAQKVRASLQHLENKIKELAAGVDEESARMKIVQDKTEINFSEGVKVRNERFDESVSTYKQQFTAALTECNQQSATELQKLKSTIKRLSDEFGTNVVNHQSEVEATTLKFDEASEKHVADLEKSADKGEKRIDDLVKTGQNQVHEHMAELAEEQSAFFEELGKLKECAQDIVHVIGNTGMVGGYQRVANEERSAKVLWNSGAVLSMMGLIGFAIYTFTATIGGDYEWGMIGARMFVALTFGILGTYCARQATWHASIERHNRQMELELASIDPYLVPLPKDIQNTLKSDLAKTLFGQQAASTNSNNSKITVSTAELAKMLREVSTETAKEVYKLIREQPLES